MCVVPDIFYSLNLNTIHELINSLFTCHLILIIKRAEDNLELISHQLHFKNRLEIEVHGEV